MRQKILVTSAVEDHQYEINIDFCETGIMYQETVG